MRTSLKAIVVLETLVAWGALLAAAVSAFFAFAPTPEDFSSPAIGFSMAIVFAAAAAFLHFSAGHLEKHGKVLVPLHLAPFVLIGVAIALPRAAA